MGWLEPSFIHVVLSLIVTVQVYVLPDKKKFKCWVRSMKDYTGENFSAPKLNKHHIYTAEPCMYELKAIQF